MRKLIASFEMIGGFIVIGSFTFQLFFMLIGSHHPTSHITSKTIFLLIPFMATFGILTLVAGYNLWHDKNSGYELSFIIQILQTVSIQTQNFQYLFYSIFGIVISFSKTGINTLYGLGFSYFITNDPQPVTTTFVGINLVSFVLLIILMAMYRKRPCESQKKSSTQQKKIAQSNTSFMMSNLCFMFG